MQRINQFKQHVNIKDFTFSTHSSACEGECNGAEEFLSGPSRYCKAHCAFCAPPSPFLVESASFSTEKKNTRN